MIVIRGIGSNVELDTRLIPLGLDRLDLKKAMFEDDHDPESA